MTPNLLLVALPTVVAFGNILTSAAAVAVAFIGAAAFLTAQREYDRISLTVASLILPAGGLAIALRPNPPETMVGTIYFAVVCCVMALVVSKSATRSSAIASLIDGLGLLLVAAVALRYAGIGNTGHTPVVMGNFLTGGERVVFPLAGALTSGPTLAAAYLVAAIPLVRRTSRYRAYRLVGVVAALYVLVQGDRRSALFAAILLLAMVALTPRLLRQVAPWVIGFSLTVPFTITLAGGLTQQLNLSGLQRSGELNSESLNDRLEIWSRCINFYQNRVDWYHQTFGAGTSGQIVSGASATYRSFFAGTPDSGGKSPHNSVLQTLFDGGWIAASGLVITIVYLAYVISRRNSLFDLTSLAMLTLLSIVGSTETLLSPGYPQPVWWALVALGMIGFAKESPGTTSLEPTATADDVHQPDQAPPAKANPGS